MLLEILYLLVELLQGLLTVSVHNLANCKGSSVPLLYFTYQQKVSRSLNKVIRCVYLNAFVSVWCIFQFLNEIFFSLLFLELGYLFWWRCGRHILIAR